MGQGVVIASRTVGRFGGTYDELVSVTWPLPGRRTRLLQQGRLILAMDGLQPRQGHEVLWWYGGVSGDVLLARQPAGRVRS